MSTGSVLAAPASTACEGSRWMGAWVHEWMDRRIQGAARSSSTRYS